MKEFGREGEATGDWIDDARVGGDSDHGVRAGYGDAGGDVSLGDLEALQGVVKFPVRIKCATLAWNTLLDALDHPQTV